MIWWITISSFASSLMFGTLNYAVNWQQNGRSHAELTNHHNSLMTWWGPVGEPWPYYRIRVPAWLQSRGCKRPESCVYTGDGPHKNKQKNLPSLSIWNVWSAKPNASLPRSAFSPIQEENQNPDRSQANINRQINQQTADGKKIMRSRKTVQRDLSHEFQKFI